METGAENVDFLVAHPFVRRVSTDNLDDPRGSQDLNPRPSRGAREQVIRKQRHLDNRAAAMTPIALRSVKWQVTVDRLIEKVLCHHLLVVLLRINRHPERRFLRSETRPDGLTRHSIPEFIRN